MRPSTRFCLWLLIVILGVMWTAQVFGQQASNWHWGDARQHRSVVRIVGAEGGGRAVRGSGVVVTWNNRPVVLTAAHVVRGLRTIIVHLHDRTWYVGKVTALDNTRDIALIDLGEVQGLEPAEVEYQSPPAKGEELTITGFGSDDRLAYDTGAVRQFVSMGAPRASAIDLPCHARPGDSGGPVFNKAGKVVGVVSAANAEPSAIISMCYGWFPKGQDQQRVVTEEEPPVLLDFYADWCQPCKDMGPEVDRLVQTGYTVRRINVDEEPEAAARYVVTSLPCFVLLHRGREVERVVGRVPGSRLISMFRRVRVTHKVYTGPVPDRVIVDPGHLRPIPLVPIPEADNATLPVVPKQCGPEGCSPAQQQRRPGLGANRDGIEINGLLPWNRQKAQKPPVIVNVPPPALQQPTGPDPAIQAQLDSIQAQLNQPQLLPPEEPKPDYSGLFLGIAIAAGLVVGVVLFYVVGKN